MDLGGFYVLSFSLLVALAKEFPDKLCLGIEIRDKVVDFVGKKIAALRVESNHKEVCLLLNLVWKCRRDSVQRDETYN